MNKTREQQYWWVWLRDILLEFSEKETRFPVCIDNSDCFTTVGTYQPEQARYILVVNFE